MKIKQKIINIPLTMNQRASTKVYLEKAVEDIKNRIAILQSSKHEDLKREESDRKSIEALEQHIVYITETIQAIREAEEREL